MVVLQQQQQSEVSETHNVSEEVPLDHLPAELLMGSQSNVGDGEVLLERQASTAEEVILEDASSRSETPAAIGENVNSSAEEAEGIALIAPIGSVQSSSVSPTFGRAEIDTTAPFESVKAAISLFGARVDWKPHYRTPSVERRSISESELHKVQEDLLYYKEQLLLTQDSMANINLELKKTNELVQGLTKTPEGLVGSPKAVEPDEVQEAEVDAENEKYVVIMSELQMVLREVENVKQEVSSLKDSNEAALKESQEAMIALDTSLQKVQTLSAEHVTVKEALFAAQNELINAEEQIELLRSGREGEVHGKVRNDSEKSPEVWQGKAESVKVMELKLEETSALVDKLKEELAGLKQCEKKVVDSVTEAQDTTEKVKVELEQAKSLELNAVTALGRVLEELDEVKVSLKKATEDGAALSSAVQAFKLEVDRGQVELEMMHDKEQTACATLASLQDEIRKVQESLKLVQAGEAKAREAKETLPTAIKEAASMADEAKAAAEAARKEVRKARHETEQAKAATSTAASRLQAAMRELEAARASEAMASAEFRAVSGSETKVAVVESESGEEAGVTLSLEEYSSLKQAAHEAEDVASLKVAAAFAQVDVAKGSQQETQAKLDVALEEAQNCRDRLQKAQKNADDAQKAKLAAEGELRKWRAEHEQRRKAGNSPIPVKMTAVETNQLKSRIAADAVKSFAQEKGMPPSHPEKTVVGLDSLAQVLSLKVPPLEKPKPSKGVSLENLLNEHKKTKKMTFLTRVASMVVGRKSKPLT